MAIVCLHISALLYLLVGILLFALLAGEGNSRPGLVVVLPVIPPLIGVIEIVAHALKRRKFWAWVAGLCIFAMYLPSLFLPLGALGLWGLLDEGSRAEFGLGGGPSRV